MFRNKCQSAATPETKQRMHLRPPVGGKFDKSKNGFGHSGLNDTGALLFVGSAMSSAEVLRRETCPDGE
jgi:hypothetical protein